MAVHTTEMRRNPNFPAKARDENSEQQVTLPSTAAKKRSRRTECHASPELLEGAILLAEVADRLGGDRAGMCGRRCPVVAAAAPWYASRCARAAYADLAAISPERLVGS
jgi:hypothetical protein